MMSTVGKPSSKYDLNNVDLLIRESPLESGLQIVVPETLRYRIMYLNRFPKFSGHPAARKMYGTIRWLYYWPLMANVVYSTSSSC